MTALAATPAGAPQPRGKGTIDLAPGSNQRDALSHADWRFMLPLGTGADVLLVGSPHAAVLDALSRSASRVVVLTTARVQAAGIGKGTNGHAENVEIVPIAGDASLPLEAGSFDLVVWTAGAAEAPERTTALLTQLARLLRPGGTLYVEGTSIGSPAFARRWAQGLAAGEGFAVSEFWLVRRAGQIRAAIPLADVGALAAYFFRDVLYGRSRLGRLLTPGASWLARRQLLHHALPARAIIVRRVENGAARPHPFAYLADLGARHGFDLGAHRSGLLARGAYDSNKVAVYLFDKSKNRPDIIVKMTRTPEFNHRLEAEHRSLRRLHELKLVDAGTYPEALFLDSHEGLAVLAQRVVAGAPFRARTTGRPDCPYAHDAIGWITRLGAGSREHAVATPRQVSARLSNLLVRLGEVYTLSRDERDFLEARTSCAAASLNRLPMVFRHGDAGSWNVLVTEAGRAAFLDWEASEIQGPPLWDLFDFVRSFGNWIGRVGGQRDSTRGYESSFLGTGPLAELQHRVVSEYCTAVGVERRFIEPLFYGCWMQRALREAAWASGPLEKGTYINLLRLCIRGRSSLGLRWLLD